MDDQQRELLFNPGELVFFKNEADLYSKHYDFKAGESHFFMLNPARAIGPASNDNVGAYRNFLLECDVGSIKDQRAKMEVRYRVPFATATFSGGKSVHYIVALEDSLPSIEVYYQYVTAIFDIVKGIDTKVKNPSRWTRTAGEVRAGVEQELLATGARISRETLDKWIMSIDTDRYLELYCEINHPKPKSTAIRPSGYREVLSYSATALLERGELYRGSEGRHDSLTKLAVELDIKGYTIDEVEQLLYTGQDQLGIERNDVPGILRWLQRRIK